MAVRALFGRVSWRKGSVDLQPAAIPPCLETVSNCHPEAKAEGSRLRKWLKMRDASLRSS